MQRGWRFTYVQNNMRETVPVYDVRMTRETPYQYYTTMSGTDNIGGWIGEGYLIATDRGVEFWMVKTYCDRAAAGQTGDFEFLVY